MKFATKGDIRAEFERDFDARWPDLSALSKDHMLFVRWLENWMDEHGTDEQELSDALFGESNWLPLLAIG